MLKGQAKWPQWISSAARFVRKHKKRSMLIFAAVAIAGGSLDSGFLRIKLRCKGYSVRRERIFGPLF